MIHLASLFHSGLTPEIVLSSLLLATAPNSEAAPMVLAGVLLSLVFIYLASKLGGELSKLVDLPPVLGELVAGVVVGVSALHLFRERLIGAKRKRQLSHQLLIHPVQEVNRLI